MILMKTRRPLVDWLRALAVLGVMLYHGNGARHGVGVITGSGWIGVDLFFVLSGFLVTRSWLARPELPTYFQRRARRVLPAFWASLVLGLGLGWALGVPGRHILTEAAFNLAFVGNALPLGASFTILLGPLWSLATEVQFWLLVPFLAPMVVRQAGHRPWVTLAALLSLPVAFRAAAALIPGMTAPWGFGDAPSLFGAVVYALPFTHMDGLLLGTFLAVAEHRRIEIPKAWMKPALLAGAVAILAGLPFRTYLPRPLVLVLFQYTGLALGFGAAVLVAWRMAGDETAPAPITWLSDRIFSLYLAQGVAGVVLTPMVIATQRMGSVGQLVVLGVFVAISTALGAALYRFVERPFGVSPSSVRSVKAVLAKS